MDQKRFVTSIFTFIVIMLVGAGIYFASTRQITSPTLFNKTDSQSLIAITDAHIKDVRQTLPDAELFEVSTFIPFQTKVLSGETVDLLIVKSHFATPDDNVRFVEIKEDFHNGERTHYGTRGKEFILGGCYRGGAAPDPDVLELYKNCGKPTGSPESRDSHLPIGNWKVDLNDIIRVARENDIQQGDIIVATIGRVRNIVARSYKSPGLLVGSFSRDSVVQQLPSDQTVVLINGREGVVEDGPSGINLRYIILDAEEGIILEKGTLKVYPPVP